eukprot:6192221-Pleurochrysis_carterae.AAC.2
MIYAHLYTLAPLTCDFTLAIFEEAQIRMHLSRACFCSCAHLDALGLHVRATWPLGTAHSVLHTHRQDRKSASCHSRGRRLDAICAHSPLRRLGVSNCAPLWTSSLRASELQASGQLASPETRHAGVRPALLSLAHRLGLEAHAASALPPPRRGRASSGQFAAPSRRACMQAVRGRRRSQAKRMKTLIPSCCCHNDLYLFLT